MSQIHYGVVKQDDGWAIIGANLRFGAYARRSSAVRAAKRLAQTCGGLPVDLHVQDDSGELLPPRRVAP
ncbi:hypothetical protein [Phenylobacterium sp.]|uniref:hypothetical protein n=1 Tax=Phenylobacterium sp. TaxID=1871053 RepID=UPI002811B407|nr:hypothetical protein [Phenylobacterium sp.]